MKASIRALEALKKCLTSGGPTGHAFPIFAEEKSEDLGKIVAALPSKMGLTQEEFNCLQIGNRLLSEDEFYKLLRALTYPYTSNGDFLRFVKDEGYWALVGLLEPIFSLERRRTGEIINDIQAILDYPHMFIDDPDLPLEEGDTFIHVRHNGIIERLAVDYMEYWPYPEDPKPAYYLKVARCKPRIDKDEYGYAIGIEDDTINKDDPNIPDETAHNSNNCNNVTVGAKK